MDESGDLGFSLNKGSSQFFLVTFLFTEKKRPLEKIARKVHKGLKKMYRTVGVLHAYHSTPITRKRLLQSLACADCHMLVIVLNKQKVYTRLQDEKAVLYNYVVNILLDRLFTRELISLEEKIFFVAARRETNQFLNQNFQRYLSSQVATRHGLQMEITIATPAEEKALQVTDFASWAVFRKYEFHDEEYYDLIRSIIIEEFPLFP